MSTRKSAADFTFADPTPPTAPAPPAPAPNGHNAVAPVAPDSHQPSDLASWLGRSEERDTSGDNGGMGASVPLSRLVGQPRLDPDLDLVSKGVSVPRYLDKALSTVAFLSGRRQQEIVAEALRAYLPQEVVAEARRAAAG